MPSTVLEIREISKSFGKLQALREVSFSLEHGETVGLIGDNGAGKSTLVNILSGVFPQDSGEIFLEGKKIAVRSSLHAKKLGIETVYQNQALALQQSIFRNLFMGREPTKFWGILDIKKAERAAMEVLQEKVGLERLISARQTIKDLSGGERASVALARIILFKARVVILDEAMLALSLVETQKFLGFVRDLRSQGISCIYVSHNISEVYSVANRFIILNLGEKVTEVSKNDISLEKLVDMMIHVKKSRKVGSTMR